TLLRSGHALARERRRVVGSCAHPRRVSRARPSSAHLRKLRAVTSPSNLGLDPAGLSRIARRARCRSRPGGRAHPEGRSPRALSLVAEALVRLPWVVQPAKRLTG